MAFAAMEQDAVEMWRKGYRMVASEERSVPLFGITYYSATYESEEP